MHSSNRVKKSLFIGKFSSCVKSRSVRHVRIT